MIQDSVAYQYCRWALKKNNRKVPEYVKKQCRAWMKIADGKDKEAYVDEQAYEKILKILKLMVHPDLNCPMDAGLEPYSMLLITATFCTKLKTENIIPVSDKINLRKTAVAKNIFSYLSCPRFFLHDFSGK